MSDKPAASKGNEKPRPRPSTGPRAPDLDPEALGFWETTVWGDGVQKPGVSNPPAPCVTKAAWVPASQTMSHPGLCHHGVARVGWGWHHRQARLQGRTGTHRSSVRALRVRCRLRHKHTLHTRTGTETQTHTQMPPDPPRLPQAAPHPPGRAVGPAGPSSSSSETVSTVGPPAHHRGPCAHPQDSCPAVGRKPVVRVASTVSPGRPREDRGAGGWHRQPLVQHPTPKRSRLQPQGQSPAASTPRRARKATADSGPPCQCRRVQTRLGVCFRVGK